MVIIFRIMQSSDVQSIAALAEEGFRDIYPFDWQSNAQALFASCETGKVFVGVAEIERQIAGYCNLRA
jgi:hypothetical protein